MNEPPFALMVSAHTTKDANVTMEALNLGAFDFISKPSGGNIQSNVDALIDQFDPILKAFLIKQGIGLSENKSAPTLKAVNAPSFGTNDKISTMLKPDIVAIGISTGGPKALAEVIPMLDSNLRVPIVIVQHMPPVFTKALAESLDKKTKLNVVEAANRMRLKPGYIYIAPGGKQMGIERNVLAGESLIKITDDEPENFCKPSVDYLFRSISKQYGKKVLGIMMTGMGCDGVVGSQLMKKQGAAIIAQNEATCTVFGMPAEAIKADVVDYIAPLNGIAEEINRIVRGY